MKHYEILFRNVGKADDEIDYAKAWFPVKTVRSKIVPESTVIGRYSVLPFYEELAEDLETKKCKLINSFLEHQTIANFDYYPLVRDVMPKAFWADQIHRTKFKYPVVVKGATNSKKYKWNTHMFAQNHEELMRVIFNLQEDSLIGQQRLLIREYVPLVTYEEGINGLKFTDEYRLFYFKNKLVAEGYYWNEAENIEHYLPQSGINFANKIANKISSIATFFTLDIGMTQAGEWMLVEVNDGQMAGLCTIDPDSFYCKLWASLGVDK